MRDAVAVAARMGDVIVFGCWERSGIVDLYSVLGGSHPPAVLIWSDCDMLAF